ncbi:AaceriAFR556Wp [[Ashbya] aceris (nom. inval.)]|nr:AaceriAFR556Wp [[Ashbya] aceris (nom. inval.)]
MFRNCLSRAVFVRRFGTPAPKVYQLDEIRRLVRQPAADKVLVDVREPAELRECKLPNAINLPLKTYPAALSLSEEEFKEVFGIDKPSPEKELIFFCQAGVRAETAQDLANSYGYEKTAVWPGSMKEWLAHGGDKDV